MIYGLKYIELDPKIVCVCHISPNIPIYSLNIKCFLFGNHFGFFLMSLNGQKDLKAVEYLQSLPPSVQNP